MAVASKRATPKRLRNVLEYAAANPQGVDRRAGVIRGVKILGLQSTNGGRYLPEAVRSARGLYEGAAVMVNHPGRPNEERKVEHQIGWLENVRVVESQGLRGDFHVVKSHPMANVVFELAERRPDKLGFSHNAVCLESSRSGESVYEAIRQVRSVDLVCRPATAKSIFESVAGDGSLAAGPSFFALFIGKAREIFDDQNRTPAEKPTAIEKVARDVFSAEASLSGSDTTSATGDATDATESHHRVDRRQLPPRVDRRHEFNAAFARATGGVSCHLADATAPPRNGRGAEYDSLFAHALR